MLKWLFIFFAGILSTVAAPAQSRITEQERVLREIYSMETKLNKKFTTKEASYIEMVLTDYYKNVEAHRTAISLGQIKGEDIRQEMIQLRANKEAALMQVLTREEMLKLATETGPKPKPTSVGNSNN